MRKEIELYETIYLLNPSFTQNEITTNMERYQTLLIQNGSEAMVQNHGKRNLSYPIKGFNTANYIQLLYLANGNVVNLLHKELGQDESILRNLTTGLPSLDEVQLA